MTQDGSEQQKIEEEKAYGDSASAVTPDTQQRAQGEPVTEDQSDDEEQGEDRAGDGQRSDPLASGTDADTVSDGPDKESGFYG